MTVIKRPFLLSTSIEKQTVATAMPSFYILYKAKNHHFSSTIISNKNWY